MQVWSRKRVAVLLAAIVTLSYGSSAYALELREDDLSEYLAIVDRVNAEYGTDFKFVTEEESQRHGIPMPSPSHLGSPAEFEKNLRAEMAEASCLNAEAERLSRIASMNAIDSAEGCFDGVMEPLYDENGEVVGTVMWARLEWGSASAKQPPTRASHYVIYMKNHTSALGFGPLVKGTIDNGMGYWIWLSLPSYVGAWYPSPIPYPKFVPNGYSAKLIDGTRTISVTYYGTLYGNSSSGGVAATRYVDFNAGSAAAYNGY